MAGQARKLRNRFRFLVEIDGFEAAGFQKAGPLKGGVELIEHREGNTALPDKSPGQGKFENITLERGATDNRDEYDWFAQVLNAAEDTAGDDPGDYKRNLAIVECDNKGREVGRWNVYGAFPIGFTAGEWDGTSNEKTIRSVELAIDYFEPA